jgi:DNA-binding transcriptional LysR family regulator
MELRQLRYFVAVAEDLHFGHAATRLHIVQSALSRQISLLERELGVHLLDRSGRGVALTDAGADLLSDARRLLASADAARERATRAGKGERGTLRVGFIAPAVYEVLPRTLRAFQRQSPQVRLILHEVPNAPALAGLVSGDLDIAFVRLPLVPDPMLTCVEVSDEPVMIALPHDHRLAAQEEIDLADLAEDHFIMIPRAQEPELFDDYVGMCRTAGFSPRVSHDADRTHVALGLVSGGLGVAFVPASSRSAGLDGVVHRSLRDVNPRLVIGLAWSSLLGDATVENFVKSRPWMNVAGVR